MRQLRHIWFIAAKDLKLFVTDRVALVMYVLFPFLFVIVFSIMFRGVGAEDERLSLHILTHEDAGGLSHQIIAGMETREPDALPPGQPEIVWDKDYTRALQDVQDGDLPGFLAFPADFTRGLMMGYGTELEVVVNPANTTTRAALLGLASSLANQAGSQQIASNAAISLIVEQSMASGDTSRLGIEIQRIVASVTTPSATPSLISYETEKVGDVEANNPANFIVPGYLVMFTFFAAAQAASMIVRERQNNTLERLLASSARRESILAGMFAGTFARGLLQITVFWTVGLLVFRLDMGQSPLAVITLSLLMVLVSASFAVMLATLARTEKSAGALAVLVSLVLAPLGGCWWPLFITPKWMQSIARLIPHGWANMGFNELMLFGAGLDAVVVNMLALVGFSILFGVIAVARFRTSAV